jgi:hypothetical protein
MHTNIITTATALSDNELLARLQVLARSEREASVELVAHLAVLDTRPALYAAEGYGSLFSYCTQALRLSEDATHLQPDRSRAGLSALPADPGDARLRCVEPHVGPRAGKAPDAGEPRGGPGACGEPQPP